MRSKRTNKKKKRTLQNSKDVTTSTTPTSNQTGAPTTQSRSGEECAGSYGMKQTEQNVSQVNVCRQLHKAINDGEIQGFDDLAASAQWMADILFIEKEINKSLIDYNTDPVSAAEDVYLLERAHRSLEISIQKKKKENEE